MISFIRGLLLLNNNPPEVTEVSILSNINLRANAVILDGVVMSELLGHALESQLLYKIDILNG